MDQAATLDFEDFALACSGALYRQAWALCGDRHQAEDLVQETLAKVFVKWRRIETPYAYSQRTLMRTYISQRRRRSSTEQPWAEVPQSADAMDPTALSDLRISLRDALAELAPRTVPCWCCATSRTCRWPRQPSGSGCRQAR